MKTKATISLCVVPLVMAVCANAATIPLNGPWFTGAATGSNPTTGGTPSITNPNTNTFSWGTGPSASGQSAIRGMLWTYFPMQSLANDGDSLSVTFTLRVTDTLSSGGANGFRFGLFNSGGSRLTSNLSDANTDPAFSLSLGYSVMWTPWPNPTTVNSTLRLRTVGNDNALSTTGSSVIQTLALGADILSGSPRQASLTITRNSATEYQVESTMDSQVLSGTTVTIAATDFDSFYLLNTPQGGGNNSIDFTNFTVHFIPAWELSANLRAGAPDLVLSWNSRADSLYRILTAGDPTIPWSTWTVLQSNILAAPPVNSKNIPASGPMEFFVIEESPHPVRNAGFEADVLAEGTRTGTPTAWTQGYYDQLAPTVWVVGESGGGVYNPDATQGYGGVAPQGQNVLHVTARIGFDNGLRQVLSTKVQANLRYDLSVRVGNPFLLNANQATADYRIELVAGGVVLASATGLSPADDSAWTKVSVSYSSGATPAQLDQALEIRLLAVEYFDGLQLDFDEVLLAVTPVEPTPVFSDDFESGAAGWTQGSDGTAGTVWELGVPETVGPAAAHSPTNCYGTNIRQNYGLNANVWLRSPGIDLTAAPSATLRFWQHIDIEPQFDFGSVRILDASNDAELAVIEARVEGRNIDWAQYSTALPTAALGIQIKIEFRLQSDNLDSYGGWYIDDLVVLVP